VKKTSHNYICTIGREHPIAFASQKLSGSQLNWAIIEKEAYAIIWALNKFRDIVYGAHIIIRCDHNPLQYIRECAPKSAKLLRWALALQEFDVDVQYTKGHTMLLLTICRACNNGMCDVALGFFESISLRLLVCL